MKIKNGRYWNLGWQLIDGCTPCSLGCEHCWSASMAHIYKRSKKIGSIPGEPIFTDSKRNFTGKIGLHHDRLDVPLKRKKPTVYSVWNDFAHERIAPEFILRVYETMVLCPQHTFLILTKRPTNLARQLSETGHFHFGVLPNIYYGLTICNQQEADEKIPVFLQVPGKKFLNIEPMLGEIDIYDYLIKETEKGPWPDAERDEIKTVDVVILGGETGPGARPVHPDWVKSVKDQCAAAGVPFYFKQWGEWLSSQQKGDFGTKPVKYKNMHSDGTENNLAMYDLIDDAITTVYRVGKKKAGRLLDDREHNDLPWVVSND